jgi:hypothetical protein
MAKTTKDVTATAKKAPTAPVDPAKTKDLIRLINILTLLLAITAFLLQLFAVLTHHWKWQITGLRPIISPNYHYAEPNVYDDSRLDQNYGLFSRNVKLYAHHDEQLAVRASTRFPRVDDGESALHECLSETSTLRGALLTCSWGVISSDQCHCRRYVYWNVVIVFEILALVLLGIVVFLVSLLTTQFHRLLKLAGAGLSLLAFILLLVGLILILSHLKRETHSIADTYPHMHQRLSEKLGVVHDPYSVKQRRPSERRHTIQRRQAREQYRAYTLLPGQHPYNDTHFQEYSVQDNTWVYIPYSSYQPVVPYVPISQRGGGATYTTTTKRTTTTAPAYGEYGPLLGYDRVFENTSASIGWSTILSILAMILALLLPLLLIFSWITDKKLGPVVKTVKTTTVKTEYSPVPHDAIDEATPFTRPIHTDYDQRRPIGDAAVTSQHARQTPYEPVIVRDVVIRDEQPSGGYVQQYPPQSRNTQEHSFPVNIETTPRN